MRGKLLIILFAAISPGLFSQADFRMILESALGKEGDGLLLKNNSVVLE